MPDDPTYRLKDDVPYGTYIEVDAYYVSINPEKVGSGSIKYRFMLGKDVETDYNAERNYHYKLTLVLKNFANDADWHNSIRAEPSAKRQENKKSKKHCLTKAGQCFEIGRAHV